MDEFYSQCVADAGGDAEGFIEWLNKVRAESWDEGCMAGRNREHHKNMTDEQAAEAWPNPYKELL